MPEISMFYGIIIRMYDEANERQHIPHIHAEYQGKSAQIGFDGQLLAGNLPPKKLDMVRVWMDIHQEELIADWSILTSGGKTFRIDPLR